MQPLSLRSILHSALLSQDVLQASTLPVAADCKLHAHTHTHACAQRGIGRGCGVLLIERRAGAGRNRGGGATPCLAVRPPHCDGRSRPLTALRASGTATSGLQSIDSRRCEFSVHGATLVQWPWFGLPQPSWPVSTRMVQHAEGPARGGPSTQRAQHAEGHARAWPREGCQSTPKAKQQGWQSTLRTVHFSRKDGRAHCAQCTLGAQCIEMDFA